LTHLSHQFGGGVRVPRLAAGHAKALSAYLNVKIARLGI
jgi:hypothetical protein